MSKIKSTVFYTFSQYSSKIVVFFIGIVIRRILGPTAIGGLSFINVISNYIDYLYAPIRTAVLIEAPILNGKNKINEAQKILDAGYFMIVFLSVIGSGIVLLVLNFNFTIYVKFGLSILLISNIFNAMSTYYEVYLRVKQDFDSISKRILLVGMANPIITLFLTVFFNYKGYFIGMLIVSFLSFAFYKKKINIKINFDIVYIKRIILLGVPFVINGFIFVNIQNIDKVIIKFMLGDIYLGYYSIGDLFLNNILIFSSSIYAFHNTALLEDIGKGNEIAIIEKTHKVTSIIRVGMPIIIALSWIFIDILMNTFLKKFQGGIFSAKILLIGAYFLSIYGIYEVYLIGKGRVKKLIVFSLIILCLSGILHFVVLKSFGKIEYAALVVTMTYLLYSQGVVWISLKIMKSSITDRLRIIWKNIEYGIPIYCLAIAEVFISNKNFIIKNIIIFLLFIFTYLILIWFNKKDLNIIIEYIKKKLKKDEIKN